MTPYEAAEILSLWEKAEFFEDLIWRVDMTPGRNRDTRLFAMCSDVFHWATADAEEITRDDIPLLKETLRDLRAHSAGYLLPELFAARKRHLRPQEPFMRDLAGPERDLFLAAGTAEGRAEADREEAAFWGHVAAHVRRKGQE